MKRNYTAQFCTVIDDDGATLGCTDASNRPGTAIIVTASVDVERSAECVNANVDLAIRVAPAARIATQVDGAVISVANNPIPITR